MADEVFLCFSKKARRSRGWHPHLVCDSYSSLKDPSEALTMLSDELLPVEAGAEDTSDVAEPPKPHHHLFSTKNREQKLVGRSLQTQCSPPHPFHSPPRSSRPTAAHSHQVGDLRSCSNGKGIGRKIVRPGPRSLTDGQRRDSTSPGPRGSAWPSDTPGGTTPMP